MGHGDEIVLADANYPTTMMCRGGVREIRADGHKITELLEAIMQFLPLDTYVYSPVFVMDPVAADKAKRVTTPIWTQYEDIINKAEGKKIPFSKVERFEFYEQSKRAFAIVQTGETALYSNIILKKGVISD
jgi:L-fucose mutarotase